MEEDIKILENVLETKEYGLCEITDTFYKALENLLKLYKELEQEVESQDKTIDNLIECQNKREKYTHSLEKENAMLKKANNITEDITQVINKSLEEFKREFIPISVIEKKIGEVNNSNGYSPVNKIFIEKVLNEILEERRR